MLTLQFVLKTIRRPGQVAIEKSAVMSWENNIRGQHHSGPRDICCHLMHACIIVHELHALIQHMQIPSPSTDCYKKPRYKARTCHIPNNLDIDCISALI